jgi:hypothetical protein
MASKQPALSGPNTEQQSSGDLSGGNPLNNILLDDLVPAGHAPAFRQPSGRRWEEAIRETQVSQDPDGLVFPDRLSSRRVKRSLSNSVFVLSIS